MYNCPSLNLIRQNSCCKLSHKRDSKELSPARANTLQGLTLNMPHPAEYAVFFVLIGANLGLGLYFAFRKRVRGITTEEVFLGSRTLSMFPLAISILASLMSSGSIVSVAGHFYAYGGHMTWSGLTVIIMLPFTAYVVLPVMYNLRITSVFQVSSAIEFGLLSFYSVRN